MTKKKNWIKVFACGAVVMGGLTAANAHSIYRTFKIKPFAASTSVSYTKSDSSTKIGVSLTQAGVEEVRDTINFVITQNGYTVYSQNVTEGEAKTNDNYQIRGSNTVLTYKDTDYNLGSHSVKGTLYW